MPKIDLTREDKVLFPKSDITKADLVSYYRRIAPKMLPFTKGRFLVMQRFPDGITGERFYQKRVPEYFPKWIQRKNVKLERGGSESLVIARHADDLAYLANQAVIVMHLWLSPVASPHTPDRIIFDLDPSGTDLTSVRLGARILKRLLERDGLKPFVMTTGSRAFHVIVPIKPEHHFDVVRGYCRSVAQRLVDERPDTFTLHLLKRKRRGRIFVDYLRNNFGATGVAPYSARAIEGAPVATPLAWSELGRVSPQQFTIRNVLRRGNPWAAFFRSSRRLKL